MSSNTPITHGAHHVGLTVPDLGATRDFFVDALGFELLGESPDYPAAFVKDTTTMITLWQAEDPETATPFDRKNVIGLHHLALLVENHATLDALHEKLQDTNGVDIEFAPEAAGTSGARHLMISIPGGIRLEFRSLSD